MMASVPYKLRGTSVVKSDSGEVVKTHPTREKALAHLRALKANVEEGSPGVLGLLLEGFAGSGELRDFRGRWRKGDKVHVVTPQGHVDRGVVEKPAETYDAITSKGTERSTTVQVKWADGDVTHERPQDIKAGHPGSKPSGPNPMSSSSRERGLASIEAGRRTDRPRIRPEDRAAFNAVTGLGREGTAARGRGAPNVNVEHADTRDKLTNLPRGQRYGLHGPEGQVGHVERTAQGWAVTGPDGAVSVHKTPSSAAGRAMRIQRQAAANYQARQRTRAANLDRMGIPLGKIGEPLPRRRYGSRRPYAQESAPAPGLLGALLEGAALSERFVSTDKRSELAKKGHALHVDGKDIFPIESAKDAQNALTLWQSGHHKTAAAKAHILKNARRVGAQSVVRALAGGS